MSNYLTISSVIRTKKYYNNVISMMEECQKSRVRNEAVSGETITMEQSSNC